MTYKFLASLTSAAIATAPLALAAQSAGPDAGSSAASQTQTQTTASQGSSAQTSSPQARIDAAIHAAAEAHVPTSLLTSKVAEGQAKHVPPTRIANAVESRLKSLVQASSVLDRADIQSDNAASLSVTADALEAGVTQNALISLSRSAPDQRRVVAVAVLADLVRLGQTSDAALARVNSAISTSAALANLNAEVASQLRLGGLTSTLDAVGILRIP